jgi:hypothetical protein
LQSRLKYFSPPVSFEIVLGVPEFMGYNGYFERIIFI